MSSRRKICFLCAMCFTLIERFSLFVDLTDPANSHQVFQNSRAPSCPPMWTPMSSWSILNCLIDLPFRFDAPIPDSLIVNWTWWKIWLTEIRLFGPIPLNSALLGSKTSLIPRMDNCWERSLLDQCADTLKWCQYLFLSFLNKWQLFLQFYSN